MKAEIHWQGDACFKAVSGSGHEIIMDGPADHGGRNLGPRPMEALLMAVGGCSSFDVVHILKKSRQAVTGCYCEMHGQRAEDEVPAVFNKIHLHFHVRGHALKESQVRRAVALSAEKYCSASIMLSRGGVEITHDFSIEDEPLDASAQES